MPINPFVHGPEPFESLALTRNPCDEQCSGILCWHFLANQTADRQAACCGMYGAKGERKTRWVVGGTSGSFAFWIQNTAPNPQSWLVSFVSRGTMAVCSWLSPCCGFHSVASDWVWIGVWLSVFVSSQALHPRHVEETLVPSCQQLQEKMIRSGCQNCKTRQLLTNFNSKHSLENI